MSVGALSQSALWVGPTFLVNRDYPAEPRQEVTLSDEEVKESACRAISVVVQTPLNVLMHSKSSWYQLKVRIAWVIKFKHAICNKSSLRYAKIKVNDLSRAELSIVKFIQHIYYG